MANALQQYMRNATLTIPSDADMIEHLQDSINQNDKLGGGGNYLRFNGKTGAFSMGRGGDGVEDRLFLLETASFVDGWICWKGSKPVGKHIWSIFTAKDDAVLEDALEDHGPYNVKKGEGWKRLRGFGFVPLEQGTPAAIGFENNSASGCNSIDALKGQVVDQVKRGEPSIPVFSFYDELFDREQDNYKPMFDVAAWVTRPASVAFLAGELTEKQLLAGKAPKKKKAARKGQ